LHFLWPYTAVCTSSEIPCSARVASQPVPARRVDPVGSRRPSASPQALQSAPAAPPTRRLRDLIPAPCDWARGHNSTSLISILRPALPSARIHPHINHRGCGQGEVNLRLCNVISQYFPSHLPATGEISTAASVPSHRNSGAVHEQQLSAATVVCNPGLSADKSTRYGLWSRCLTCVECDRCVAAPLGRSPSMRKTWPGTIVAQLAATSNRHPSRLKCYLSRARHRVSRSSSTSADPEIRADGGER
jgi:hypothetical protein